MMWRDRKSPPLASATTADPAEIARFTALADAWWSRRGSSAPVRLNPVRLGLHPRPGMPADEPGVGARTSRSPACGSSISAAGVGDPAPARRLLGRRGRRHRRHGPAGRGRAHSCGPVGAPVTYRHALAEDLAEAGERFDLILNTEVVEHVANVERFLASCCQMLNPGGMMVIATLNRTVRSLLSPRSPANIFCGCYPRELTTGAASSRRPNWRRCWPGSA